MNSGSHRPIDVSKRPTPPSLILDEPQKTGGEHRLRRRLAVILIPCSAWTYFGYHNGSASIIWIYVLDAVDAYNQRLVKKIEVKGFEVKNPRGTRQVFVPGEYHHLAQETAGGQNVNWRSKLPEVNQSSNPVFLTWATTPILNPTKWNRRYKGTIIVGYWFSHKRYTVSTPTAWPCPGERWSVMFPKRTCAESKSGEPIISHFEREKHLFELGVKTLSLFFSRWSCRVPQI